MTFNVMKSFSLSISWYREPDESTLDSSSEPDSRDSESTIESLSESCSKDFSSERELDPSESLELELSAEDEGSDS